MDLRKIVKFFLTVGLGVMTVGVGVVSASDNTLPGLCYDVQGVSPFYDSGNSGDIDFDANAQFQHQLCVDNNAVGSVFPMHGWFWNNNIGWVSAMCPGGAGAQNVGVDCGITNYESFIDPSTGVMSGFLWGDGIGYIALNCGDLGGCNATDGNFAVTVETSGPDAGRVLPGNGYAWSDNLGWVDLSGMEIPWVARFNEIEVGPLTPPAGWTISTAGSFADPLDGKVYGYITPDPGSYDSSTVNLTPIAADGTNKYSVRLMLEDVTGAAINSSFLQSVTLDTDDNVLTNQVDNSGPSAVSWNVTNNSTPVYQVSVSSIAPTSNINGADKDSDATIDCHFSVDGATRTATNTAEGCDANGNRYYARLNGSTPFNVSIVDTSDPGYLIEWALDVPVYGDHELKFAPIIGVDFLSLDSSSLDVNIQAFRNQLVDIFYNVVNRNTGQVSNASANVYFEVSADDASMDLIPLPPDVDLDTTVLTPSATQVINQYIIPATEFNLLSTSSFFIRPTLRPATGGGVSTGSSVIQDPRIKGIVEYSLGGELVRYFTNGIPWQKTLLFNPGVDVRSGDVNVQGAVKVSDDVDVRATSDVGTDQVRTAILRNVQRFISGIDKPTRVSNITMSNNFRGQLNEGVLLQKNSDFPAGSVSYMRGNVRIADDAWWTGNQTLIVEGGNVFIDNDLAVNAPGGAGDHLGIVVLADRTQSDYSLRGGNIYIHPDVTDLINVNIYADGSVFSYDPSAGVAYDTSTGEPNWGGKCEDFLNNQLYIKGSVSSKNTIGGADRTPAILGDGQTVASFGGNTTISDRERAKKYDWNYVRCFGQELVVDGNGQPVDANNDGEPDVKAASNGDFSSVLNPGAPGTIVSWAPVAIDYSPPRPDDLPVFAAGE